MEIISKLDQTSLSLFLSLSLMPKQEMRSGHMETSCVRRPVLCSYSRIGCGVTVPMCDLAKHMADELDTHCWKLVLQSQVCVVCAGACVRACLVGWVGVCVCWYPCMCDLAPHMADELDTHCWKLVLQSQVCVVCAGACVRAWLVGWVCTCVCMCVCVCWYPCMCDLAKHMADELDTHC